jgi:hypothetical protein
VHEPDQPFSSFGAAGPLIGADDRHLDVLGEEAAIIAAVQQHVDVLLHGLADVVGGHHILLSRFARMPSWRHSATATGVVCAQALTNHRPRQGLDAHDAERC